MDPLSFGQLSVLRFISLSPSASAGANVAVRVPVPAGTPEADIRERVARLAKRHESLRTSYEWGGNGDARQRVRAPRPELYDIETRDEHDPDAVLNDLRTTTFTLTDDVGWKAAVLLRQGRLAAVALVLHHIVADGWSLRTLRGELDLGRALAHDTAAPLTPRLLARAQRSPEWAGRRRAVRRHWSRITEEGLLKAVDPHPLTGGGTRLDCSLTLGSLARTTAGIATSYAVSPATVMLALHCLEIAHRWQARRFVVWLMCSNRTTPEFKSIVTSMNQFTPMVVEIDPSSSVRDLMARLHVRALGASSRACYDPYEVMGEAATAIGGEPLLENLFNFAEEWPVAAGESAGPAVISDVGASRRPAIAQIYTRVVGGNAPTLQLHADADVLDRQAITECLWNARTRLERMSADLDLRVGSVLDAHRTTRAAEPQNG